MIEEEQEDYKDSPLSTINVSIYILVFLCPIEKKWNFRGINQSKELQISVLFSKALVNHPILFKKK